MKINSYAVTDSNDVNTLRVELNSIANIVCQLIERQGGKVTLDRNVLWGGQRYDLQVEEDLSNDTITYSVRRINE